MQLKPIYKKMIIITGRIIFLSFTIISMAFVNNEYKKKKVESIHIQIISDNQPMMSSIKSIEKYIEHFELPHQFYYRINFYEIENHLNKKNEIKNSTVYFTPNKQLYIIVKERKPIARIISKHQQYYIDDEWKTLKITQPYKVPIIINDVHEPATAFQLYPIYKTFISENFRQVSTLDDIYIILNTLYSDTVLYNFIDHIHINKNHEITLYPVIGKFKITSGQSNCFKEKMNKLKLFIINGLNKNNAWNKYTEINIKYKNLIYCTKK
ncbi:MAG: hypothetical protein D6799_06795 [Bacteroidetes bacterium]|nr:MAG: hypothetical protein D6799_06795 [Bacteroidota bacterium]